MDWVRSSFAPRKGCPSIGSIGGGGPCVSAMSTAPRIVPGLVASTTPKIRGARGPEIQKLPGRLVRFVGAVSGEVAEFRGTPPVMVLAITAAGRTTRLSCL